MIDLHYNTFSKGLDNHKESYMQVSNDKKITSSEVIQVALLISNKVF